MKKFVSLFTALSIVLGTLGAFAVFADETEDITEISTLAQLEAFRDDVNGGNTYEGKTVKLTADIDMSEKYGADINGEEISWSPIGTEEQSFNGVFYGRGHIISGLYINSRNTNSGLFGHTDNKSIIKNLIVDGCINVHTDTNKSHYAGAVVGHNQGIVDGCINEASVNAIEALNGGIISGGIAGFNKGIIRKCSNVGAISTKTYLIGGICGRNLGVIENCFNAGTVSGQYLIGGLCAQLCYCGRISNCYNIGSVDGDDCVGDMAGDDGGKGINSVYYCKPFDETTSDIGTAKTLEQFASGEVAYLLGDEWGQNIGVDEYPVIGGDKVYFVNNTYTNTETDDITEISTLAELEAFRDSVNMGNTYAGKTVTLTADIDMSEKYGEGKESWTPISDKNSVPFTGAFDGGFHKITGFYSTKTGLFMFNNGTIQNVSVSGEIICRSDGGGIVGNNFGKISCCSFSGNITGGGHLGGIVGANFAMDEGTGIFDCYNTATITSNDRVVGGITGLGCGNIERCYNIGKIQAEGYFASIAAGEDMIVVDCYYLLGTADKGTEPDIFNVTVLTTEQFADKASFANWDFDTVWEMDERLGRPVLRSNREEPPAEPHTHKICAEENCEDSHEDIEWTAWDSDTSLPDSAGNYYLTADVTLTEAWYVPDETALCLNGHVIATDSSGGTETTVDIDTNTVTVLTDCADTAHKFSVGDRQWARDEDNGTETLTGGIIISPKDVAIVAGSPLDMYNINISASKNAIFNTDTLNMYGCTVRGNSDGITSFGELNMRDCSILENTHGCGVYVGSGSISIGGKMIISNNFKGSKNKNLYLTKKTVVINAPLEEDSIIGVSTKKRPLTDSPTAVTGACDADYSAYFVSDNTDDYVTYSIENGEDNVVYLAADTPTEFRIMDDYTGTILAAAPKAGTYVAILAIYSDDGVLRHITTTPVTFDEPSVKSIFEDRYRPDFSNKTTLMLWYDLESMKPCCESKSRSVTVGMN